MAIRSPLVIVSGRVQQLQAGDSLDIRADQYQITNGEAAPVVIGAPVYMFGAGSFKKARANAVATANVVGLVGQSPSIANGVPGAVTIDGILSATTAEWDAVTGDAGGLTFDARYWLDPATAGKITKTAPTTVGQLVVYIGIALSTTEMKVEIADGILL